MDIKVSDMLNMQLRLQEKYKGHWTPIEPEAGALKLLWAIGEMGELIDIIKKKGEDAIMDEERVRAEYIEECADVYMYLNDMLLCFGITAEEFSNAYAAKNEYNMHREYRGVTHYEKDEQTEQ